MVETTVIATGRLEAHPADAQRIETYLPSQCVQSHASNIMPLSNGDLLCAWFAGTQEGIADISIYMSRLNAGETTWTEAVKLSEDSERSEQNPVIFEAPDGRVWLLYTAQRSGNQDTAIVRCRISEDKGNTWGPVQVLFEQPGTFIRQPVVVLDNGEWLVPVFYCLTEPGEKWVGNYDVSAVKISADQGATWQEYAVPQSRGCVHMNVEKLPDGSLVAFFRSRWADHVYVSRSQDNGRTWSEPEATELPNNNSSIQFTCLQNGHLAMVCNLSSAADAKERRVSLYDEIEEEEAAPQQAPEARAMESDGKEAFWGAPRAPMSLLISTDGGRTWPYRRNLEVGDGYCMSNNSKEKKNREYSYPSIKQTPDGKLHITYTYFRQAIKYVTVAEDWVKG